MRFWVALALACLAAAVERRAMDLGRRIPRRVARLALACMVAATVAIVAAAQIVSQSRRPP